MGDGPQVRAQLRRTIRDFLSTRRAAVTPEQAGLPPIRGHRRVKGLRREEVAALAGISVEYYIRLERGDARGVSETVLENIGRALRLDEPERAHLRALLQSAGGVRPCRLITAAPVLRPPVQRIVDSMTGTAAMVIDGRWDLVGANTLGRALHRPARFVFLDPAARTYWPDWDEVADDYVNGLRAESGRNPCDRGLTALAEALCAGSAEFRARWERHDVHVRTSGVRRFHHPLVGALELPFESTPLASDPGQTLIMFSAEPGSPSEDAMVLLELSGGAPSGTSGWPARSRR
ncbi:helix-turn-helix domain-containing protein [Catenuloplanes japonicus]|uniref:helix-turn-helix domain-containing protein n=1 Tax=Catenuloplanes japonicus TaxID=33876 RepID=UPI00068C4DDD|nr:helix-turn-helix transcriptional regulator [Catenuloplanes japonicus]